MSNPDQKEMHEELSVVPQGYELSDEDRADILAAMEAARRTQPEYRARMEAACRLTEHTMRRRFTV